MKIRYKLTLGYVAIALLIAVVGNVSLVKLDQIAYRVNGDIPQTIHELARTSALDRLAHLMRYYNEILTQSARNYAFTQDAKWEQRHRDTEAELNTLIADAIAKSARADKESFEAIRTASLAILRLEHGAVELVKSGHPDQALGILDGNEYAGQRQDYTRALDSYFNRKSNQKTQALSVSASVKDSAVDRARKLIAEGRIQISVFLATAVFLAVVLGLIISHQIAGSVAKLRAATIQIGKGNLYSKPDIKTNDEFGQLAQSFGKMAQDLKRMIENLYQEIARRTKIEATLRKNEHEKRTILDHMSENVVYQDLNNKVLWANQAACESVGMTAEELIGRHCYQVWYKRSEPCTDCPVVEACKTGEPQTAEITGPDGRVWLVMGQPVTDTKGDITGAVEVSLEITARKMAEETMAQLNRKLKATVRDLKQSDRQIREFVHIAAHDLKTPLRGIGTLAEWLTIDYAENFDEEGRKNVNLLMQKVRRLDKLIDSMLLYAKIKRTESRKVEADMNQLVRDVVCEIPASQNVQISVDTKLPVYRCEVEHMHLLFHNLLTNAVEAMDQEDGWVIVSCEDEEDLWRFSVTDNGPGIEKRYFERIFEMFQTLVPAHQTENTGLGLTLAKKIVEMYGGEIWVESEVGEGTTFWFTLPKERAAEATEQVESATA